MPGADWNVQEVFPSEALGRPARSLQRYSPPYHSAVPVGGHQRPRFAYRALWNIDSGSASVRLDVEGPDDVAQVGRRTLKDCYAQGAKSRLDLGISEGGIDLLVELVDDLGRRVLGNADTMPAAGLEVRHKFAQGWNVR